MTKCEIYGLESNISNTGTIVSGGLSSGRTSRGSGNFCMSCMSNMMQDRNYPLLYQATKRHQNKKIKPRKVSFVLFGHNDVVKINHDINFLPVTFAQNFLKKFGKNDQIIVFLLTDSYDEYFFDSQTFKGLHSQLQKTCKKVQIDYYLLNFLSHKLRSDDSILRYFRKILNDFIHLTGNQDQVNLLITEGLPFNMDFIQLWYNQIVQAKSARFQNLVYGNIENQQTKLLEIEITAKFGKDLLTKADQDVNSGFINSFLSYLENYLHIKPN